MEIVERFINYTKFDTQSAEDSETVPSTSKQLIFAKYLKEELEREGLKDVEWTRWAISTPLSLPIQRRRFLQSVSFLTTTQHLMQVVLM